MKKTALALALILALSFSAVAGVMFVNLVGANPVWYGWFPTEPDTSPLLIIVYSPMQNQTYYSQNIILNLTMTKPETWFRLYSDNEYIIVGKITSVYYSLDGVENQSIPIDDSSFFSSGRIHNPNRTLGFSVNLLLPEGTYRMTVSAEGESYYMPSDNWSGGHATIAVNGASEVISFTVAKPSEPERDFLDSFSRGCFWSVNRRRYCVCILLSKEA